MLISINKKNLLISIACIIISIISGIFANDILIGVPLLASGLLCFYFASEGKKINYVLSFINDILMGYIAYKNNLYGTFFFYVFVCTFLQIIGFINWNRNSNETEIVNVREFTFKNSIVIISLCIVLSMLGGYLLNLIPLQRLAFMDATSNCINLCATILMNLRFKESWWVWLANNIIDVIIWSITLTSNGKGTIMMLLVSIGYLLINIYGIIKWTMDKDKQIVSV